MTITATVPKIPYTASGSNNIFPYTFKVFDASEVIVLVNGTQVTTGFAVDGVGNATGGNVTFTVNPVAGTKIILYSRTILSQATDWGPNDPDPAESKENAFDKLTKIAQEHDEAISRTLRAPIIESLDMTLPAVLTRQNKVLGFDSSGLPTVVALNASAGGDISLATALATGSTTSRSLASRFKDQINVKDYGAVGDGITDDTTFVQAACTAVPAGGATVYFPFGNYILTSANILLKANTRLHIPTGSVLSFTGHRLTALNVNNIAIDGGGTIQFATQNTSDAAPNADVDGRGCIEFMGTAATPVVGFVMLEMVVIGDGAAVPVDHAVTLKRRGIYTYCAQNVRVIGCDVRQIHDEAILNGGVGSRNIIFANNNVKDCSQDGLNFQGPTHGNQVMSNNTIKNCVNGIELSAGQCIGNVIDTTINSGIFTGGGLGGNLTVRGNYIYNVGTVAGVDGINVNYSSPQNYVVVCDNYIENPYGEGIDITQVNDLVCCGNTILGAGRGGTAAHAIFLNNITRGWVDRNAYTGPITSGTEGIAVGNGNTDLYFGINMALQHSTGGAYTGMTNAGTSTGPKPIRAATINAALTGSVAETDLRASTMKGRSTGTTGGFSLMAMGNITGVAGTKTIRLKFGATTIATLTEAAGNIDNWRIEAWCMNGEVNNAQIWTVIIYQALTIAAHVVITSAEDTTADKIVKVTGQLANAGDSINCQLWLVEPRFGVKA